MYINSYEKKHGCWVFADWVAYLPAEKSCNVVFKATNENKGLSLQKSVNLNKEYEMGITFDGIFFEFLFWAMSGFAKSFCINANT